MSEDTQKLPAEGPHGAEHQRLTPTDSKELKPFANKNRSELEGDSTVCQAEMTPALVATLTAPSWETLELSHCGHEKVPDCQNQLPSFSAYPVWPLGYETMLNEYVIVCTLIEWNFPRKVTVLKFHTNVNVRLEPVLVEMGMNSQSHNH